MTVFISGGCKNGKSSLAQNLAVTLSGSGKRYYVATMARGLLPSAVTTEDVIRACGGKVPSRPSLPPEEDPPFRAEEEKTSPQKLPLWRKVAAAAAGTVAGVTFLKSVGLIRMRGVLADVFGTQYGAYAVLIGALFALALAVGTRSNPPIANAQVARDGRKLSRRTITAAAMILLLIPLTIFVGVFYLGDRKYYFISLLVMMESMLSFPPMAATPRSICASSAPRRLAKGLPQRAGSAPRRLKYS